MARDPKNPVAPNPGNTPAGHLHADLLPVELQELAEYEAKARIRLLEGWKKAHDKAARGKPVSADDFNLPENAFNDKKQRLDPVFSQALKEAVDEKIKAGEDSDPFYLPPAELGLAVSLQELTGSAKTGHSGVSPDAESKSVPQRIKDGFKNTIGFVAQAFVRKDFMTSSLSSNYRLAVNEKVEAYLARNPEIMQAIDNNAPLRKAFRRQYVSGTPNINIDLSDIDPRGADPEAIRQAVFERLAKQSPGLFMADSHVFDETTREIAKKTPTLKSLNYDTAYMEFPEREFKQLEKMTASEIREWIADGEFITKDKQIIRLSDAKKNAHNYGTRISDDVWPSSANMIATLKENGFRIVRIDKSEAVIASEVLHTNQRIDSTNFTWMQAIKDDQKAYAEELAKTGKKPGKFIVFGGFAHAAMQGQVDAALGIPTIAFTKGNPETAPAFEVGRNPNGAAVYFPGGEDYIDMKKLVGANDTKNLAAALEKVPGLSSVNKKLYELGRRWKKEAYDSIGIKPEPLLPSKGGQEKPVPEEIEKALETRKEKTLPQKQEYLNEPLVPPPTPPGFPHVNKVTKER